MTRAAPSISALLAAISIAVQTSPAYAQEAAPAPGTGTAPAAESATTPATTPETTPATPPPASEQPSYATPTRKPPPHKSRAARDIGWIALGIGAEAAAAAIVTSIVIMHDKSVRDANCDAQKVCNTNGFGAASQLNSLTVFNTVAWGVAAIGVAAGLALVIANPIDDSKRTAFVVSPNGSGAALSLRGAF
jgi:hypothetical protein